MSLATVPDRFRRHAVPLVLFVIVAVTVLVVPPIVLGAVTTRTYALTIAVLILAVGAAFPYAVIVAVGTLPLLYGGVASFAAPQQGTDHPHAFSTIPALRHVIAGISYVLGAAAVGAIGIGGQIGMANDLTGVPATLRPFFLYSGGVIVAGAFVCLQLWRYDGPLSKVDRRTVLGTVILGMLLALSPVIAFWVFNGNV